MKYAVIDIGSNSVKMSIASLKRKTYEIEGVLKKPLRLLDYGNDSISEKEIESLLRYLVFFRQEISKYNCDHRIIATSAMRRAQNRDKVVRKIKKNLGFEVEIISGQEEAKLIELAHRFLFDLERGHHLIFDIGGGSLECVEIKNGKAGYEVSAPLGTVVVKSMFPEEEISKRKHIKGVYEEIQKTLHAIEIPLAKKKTNIYISGGNPSAVSRMNLKYHNVFFDHIHGQHVYLKELMRLLEFARKLDAERLVELYAVKPHRADLAISTIILIWALLDFVDGKGYMMSKTGIREGEIIRKLKNRD